MHFRVFRAFRGKISPPDRGRMARELLKTLYRRKDHLFRVIYEYNLFPTRYMHPDWLSRLAPQLSEEWFRRLSANPRSERRLSRFILERLNISEHPFHDFEDPSHRFALLDSESLADLLFHTGVALCATTIAHQVERKKVMVLKSAIGDRAYQFALKRAPFLLGPVPPAPCRVNDPADLPLLAIQCGVHCLRACYEGMAPSFTDRMLLKLPLEYRLYWEAEESLFLGKARQAEGILRKVLLHEVKQEWAPYFS